MSLAHFSTGLFVFVTLICRSSLSVLIHNSCSLNELKISSLWFASLFLMMTLQEQNLFLGSQIYEILILSI